MLNCKMLPEMQVDKAAHEDGSVMADNGQAKRNSLRHQLRKEKVLTPTKSMNMKYEDKFAVVKSRKITEEEVSVKYAAKRISVPSMPLRSSKPWPGRKATDIDELVKHGVNVPSYLRRKETEDGIQERALSFGVMDWGLLERWTYHKKHVTNGSNRVTPCSGSECNAPPKGKQSMIKTALQHSSATSGQTYFLHKYSENATFSRDPRPSSSNVFAVNDKHLDSDYELGADGFRFHNVPLSLDSCTSSSDKMTGAKDDRTERATRDGEWREMDSFPHWNNVKDHLQQRLVSSVACNDGTELEKIQDSFSEKLLGNIQRSYQCSHVPKSCPLPCTVLAEEPDAVSTLLSEGTSRNTEEQDNDGKRNLVVASALDKLGQCDVKSTAAVEKKSPNHLAVGGQNQMSRSSSFKDHSSLQQFESVTRADKCAGDRAASNSRGRRSPLRRMLDPLLKPKDHIYFSPPADSAKNQHFLKSSNSNHPLNVTSNAPNNSELHLQRKKEAASTRQALLQLAWKNGMPLFMFSSGGCDILAATVRKKSLSDKDGVECVYTIFTVEECKRRSAAWVRSGNKSKKQQLISTIVGEIQVSCTQSMCYDLKTCHAMKQFVLVGLQLTPTSDGPADSRFNTELAAIVSTVSQLPETSNADSMPKSSATNLCSWCRLRSLQTEQSSSVLVVLPSGIHGLPISGEPSPLIERWKSGGACDCGGWDEGCMLTVLTDSSQECRSSGSAAICRNADGTKQFELFTQDRYRKEGHAFNMVSFKEGLYTVEFKASISLHQAFAISISMLHGRNHTKQIEVQCVQERVFACHE
ncbi:uncharacterized protein LOC109724022 [Ananas comosus]|uniref:Uncharacterized protein LOC109724022 n=1 Tax=Ananas comosus TaxID=4615 RepID=A0A6P5GK98_ANACO|nr:uncharacterized protein LOC109724022 [Ananas comosus]XP_020108212.1 uncharacterized protein LOC109724022 [Ananas comosus]XP_020108213.1 uncharacterized protein LOC109724022 [Ananas comosus]